MKHILSGFAVIAILVFITMLNAQAGGYSRSADEVTASYMEAVVARVVAKTAFGRAAPAPLTSRCKINVISMIRTPEGLARQVAFKERPERCVPVLATNFVVGSFQVAYPAVFPCHQIHDLLSRVLVDPKMQEIRVSNLEYDEIGFSSSNRGYNFLHGLIDQERYDSVDYKNMTQSLSRVSGFEVTSMEHYCKIVVRTDSGEKK